MSPRQTPVKISDLALTFLEMVNMGQNEAGSHYMLSRGGLVGLNIGQCDSKDSADRPPDFFWLTRAAWAKMPSRLTNS